MGQKVNENDIKEYFEKYGEVSHIDLKRNSLNGRSRGFAFVVFKDVQTLWLKAIKSLAKMPLLRGRLPKIGAKRQPIVEVSEMILEDVAGTPTVEVSEMVLEDKNLEVVEVSVVDLVVEVVVEAMLVWSKISNCKKNDVSHHDFDVLEPFLIVSMESTTPGSIGLVKADFASTGSS